MARVLIIDDNLLVRTLLREILQGGGHLVAGEAQDGRGIVDLVGDVSPDAIILDLVMPRRDGFGVLEDLRASASTVPVVICSAALTSSKVVRTLQLGAKGFITKPFDRESVLGALEALGDDRVPAAPDIDPDTARRDERRSFPRVEIALAVTLTAPSGETVRTTTLDVSGGGLLLATNPLADDTVVEFCLELGASLQPITGSARAVRSTTRQALAFEEISIVDHERLVSFLAQAQGEALPGRPANEALQGG